MAFFIKHMVETDHMPTKYELQTQLRELTRGTKPLPIGKMKKEELVREITLRERVADERDAMGPAPKAKPGPLGPRKIPIIPVEAEGMVIKTPGVPGRHPVSRKEAMLMRAVEAEPDVARVLPGVAKAAKARTFKPQEAVEEEERTTMIRRTMPRAEPKAAPLPARDLATGHPGAGAGAGAGSSSLRSQVMDILKALAAE